MAATKVDLRQLAANGAANQIIATPNLAAGQVTLRQMTGYDLPQLSSLTDVTPANNDHLWIGDVSPAQNGRAAIETVLSLGLEGFISGLEMVWVSTTQIQITTGVAHIQSGSKILKLPTANGTKTLTGLSNSTFYYLYAFESSGVLDWEWSTTAPAAPYFGTARSKPSDQSRRFIGFFRTSSTGAIFKFEHNWLSGAYDYQEDYSSAAQGFRILGPGQATSFTTVNAAGIVPPFVSLTIMRVQNYQLLPTHTTSNLFITIPSDTGTNRLISNPGADSSYQIAVNGSQQISYKLGAAGAAGSGGAYIDVKIVFMKR